MNKKDILNAIGEIDEELIEDADPAKLLRNTEKKKKFNFGWVKYVSGAAACAVILAGVIAVEPLFDRINSPSLVETDETQDEVGGNIENNNGDYFPEWGDADVEETAGEAPEEYSMEYVFNYLLNGNIPDEKLSELGFRGVECDPDQVGEKIGETTVEFFGLDGVRYEVKAEVNKIIGFDEELILCLRFINEEKNADINRYLDFDYYWILTSKEYKVDSFAQFREDFIGGEINFVSTYSTYYEKGAKEQTKRYLLGSEAFRLVKQLLNEIDGEAVDLSDGDTLSPIRKNSTERIYFSCRGSLSSLSSGEIEIHDSGYLIFSSAVYHNQLFYIGKDVAFEIIDAIIRNSELQINNTTGGSQQESVNIDVVPTRSFYNIVLHENDRHIDRVLYSLRVDQAAFMEEIMKDYQAKYSGVVGASFETAKLVSDEFLKIPIIIPKDTVEVSAISIIYYYEYDSLMISYTVGNLKYKFDYDSLPGVFNVFGSTVKQGVACFNGVEFDIYGDSSIRVGNILCPGVEDRYIRISVESNSGVMSGIPDFDMFEIIYLTPSSREDIAKIYKEEPVYDDQGDTETIIFEFEEKKR